MPRPFVLPDLGEGLTEAEIVKVLVSEGDVIREDAPLLEVETDKAQVEIPSPMSGRVAKIHVQAGQTVKVGSVLVTFDDLAGSGAAPARSAPAISPGGKQAAERGAAIERSEAPERAGAARAPASSKSPASSIIPATPATRRLARELGVDLHAVTASGPGGRVTAYDVPFVGFARERANVPDAARVLAACRETLAF